jgi:hypothetical protein
MAKKTKMQINEERARLILTILATFDNDLEAAKFLFDSALGVVCDEESSADYGRFLRYALSELSDTSSPDDLKRSDQYAIPSNS